MCQRLRSLVRYAPLEKSPILIPARLTSTRVNFSLDHHSLLVRESRIVPRETLGSETFSEGKLRSSAAALENACGV